MGDSTLYDEDILLWSEQQAAVIRRLRESARGLPNELDIENVAEEIESVGRSELATVESYIELILVHVIKLGIEPEAESALHWNSEIASFASNLQRRYALSMRQRINMDQLWRSARRQVALGYRDRNAGIVGGLPSKCPFAIDELLKEDIDIADMTGRIRDLTGFSGSASETRD